MDLASLELTDTPSGCRIGLRVRAGAHRQGILGVYGPVLKLAVGAAPERGRANRAVLELLAQALGVPARCLRLVSGQTSALKLVLIEGLASTQVRQRLREL